MLDGVIEGLVGIVFCVTGAVLLLVPRLADWFYDQNNRSIVNTVARWGWKKPLQNYEKNRAASRRLVPLGTLVVGAGMVILAVVHS